MNESVNIYNDTKERYRALKSEVEEIDRKLAAFPEYRRSIIIKDIKGKPYYYLQWREGDKVHTSYLKPVYPGAVADIEAEILEQKYLEQKRDQMVRLTAYMERLLDSMNKDMKKEKIVEDRSFELYWKDEIVSRISVRGGSAHITRFTSHPAHQLFAADKMSRDQINHVLEMRCWDKGRPDLRELLAHIGLKEYNPYEIVRRTHGVSWNDYLWFRFPGETLTSKDVLVRA